MIFQLEEEVWLDEEQHKLVEELKMEILEERRKQRGHNFGRGDQVREKCIRTEDRILHNMIVFMVVEKLSNNGFH